MLCFTAYSTNNTTKHLCRTVQMQLHDSPVRHVKHLLEKCLSNEASASPSFAICTGGSLWCLKMSTTTLID